VECAFKGVSCVWRPDAALWPAPKLKGTRSGNEKGPAR
jgi:hypothetical protein